MTQIEKLKTRLSTATDRPERSQRNPEQLVQGSQSSARPLRVQSEQLPTESQVFEDEVLAGAKRADDPPEEMPERYKHGKNIIGTIRIQLCAKSLILHMYDVLARHRFAGPTQISGHRGLPHRNPQLEQFSVNAGCSPQRVRVAHALN